MDDEYMIRSKLSDNLLCPYHLIQCAHVPRHPSLTKYIPKFTKGWVDLCLRHVYFLWLKWQSDTFPKGPFHCGPMPFSFHSLLPLAFKSYHLAPGLPTWLPVHKLESGDFGRHQASFLAFGTSNLSLTFCFPLKKWPEELRRYAPTKV